MSVRIIEISAVSFFEDKLNRSEESFRLFDGSSFHYPEPRDFIKETNGRMKVLIKGETIQDCRWFVMAPNFMIGKFSRTVL